MVEPTRVLQLEIENRELLVERLALLDIYEGIHYTLEEVTDDIVGCDPIEVQQ